MAHAKKLISLDEVFHFEPFQWRPKLRQRIKHRFGVVGIRFDEQIDVFSCARLGMKRHSITTHDEILNFLVVEDGQEFFEVLEHPAPVPSLGKPQASCPQRLSCVRGRAVGASPDTHRLSWPRGPARGDYAEATGATGGAGIGSEAAQGERATEAREREARAASREHAPADRADGTRMRTPCCASSSRVTPAA